jgi:hypothetical protein
MHAMPLLSEWIQKGNVGPSTHGGTFHGLDVVVLSIP